MTQRITGIARPCRIFMCYRNNTAETANHFRSVMEHDKDRFYGNIWYSSRQYIGRLIQDLPDIMSEVEWVIFFVGKTFTGGFLDANEETNKRCITAQELIAIETERQKRQHEGKEELKMLTINIDGARLDQTCELDLKHLFSNAKILKDDSVGAYTELLPNVYHSSLDDLFDFVEEHIAPSCALFSNQMNNTVTTPASTEDSNSVSLVKVEEKTISIKSVRYADDEIKQAQTDSVITLLENGNVLFGRYPQTGDGGIQPVEWLILKQEENRLLLISKFVLDSKPYNFREKPITWAESTLRRWLNENFLKEAFDENEQQIIVRMDISAEYNPSYSIDPGKSTNDWIFLLSVQEAKAYFSPGADMRSAPTAYAEKRGISNVLCSSKKDGRLACYWWLRTPGSTSSYAATVDDAGYIGSGLGVGCSGNGVRPAVWVYCPSLDNQQ